MGQNQHGHWDDKAMAAAQRRLDRAKERIDAKFSKRHNALVEKLRLLKQEEHNAMEAARQRWRDECEKAITLWEDKP